MTTSTAEMRAVKLTLIEAAGRLSLRQGDNAKRLCRRCWQTLDALERGRDVAVQPVLHQLDLFFGAS